MARQKMIYVTERAHQRLKILAARQDRPMGEVVEELVDREIDDLSSPWFSAEGMSLQEKALRDAWGDPALDVYDGD
jgi:hypothetical protein